MSKVDLNEIADKIASDVKKMKGLNKSMKVKTLLGHFNYGKRTDEITAEITELLANRNIVFNPSIMKLGDSWQLTWDDRVYLSVREESIIDKNISLNKLSEDWNKDGWFDAVLSKKFPNEREVETKFVIPLLARLGYSEEDRFDAMEIDAFHGSKHARLVADFALFDKDSDMLSNQVLLVVEAKKENRLHKETELNNAQKQVKSYAIWLSCSFGLVTDSNKIQVLDLLAPINNVKILFECKREDLKDRFSDLYNLISKKALVQFYESKMR